MAHNVCVYVSAYAATARAVDTLQSTMAVEEIVTAGLQLIYCVRMLA